MNYAPEKFRRGMNWAFIGGFLVLLWLPTLDSFLHLDNAPQPTENRALAQFPAFKTADGALQQFVRNVETYYNDHFGFRKQLVRWNTRWRKTWFKDRSLADVLQARDGWLFYTGDYMIDHFRGTRLFTETELQDWRALLESRHAWLKERGIAYAMVIAPDKHSVYPEFLPDWLTRVNPTTKLDQFVAFLTKHSKVPVLDLRQPLIDGKKQSPTYLCSDTHWNSFGAFLAYQNVICILSNQIPDLAPLELESFMTAQLPPQPVGDLATMIGQQEAFPERNLVALAPKPPLQPLKTSTVTNGLPRDSAKLVRHMITENPGAQGTAILFQDSFGRAWLPFLGYNFEKVLFVWQYNWNKPLIERERPRVVIDEMVERFLNKEDPRELRRKDDAPESVVASYD
jgi:alginate O-acetyltransferase complex protein AlgJ